MTITDFVTSQLADTHLQVTKVFEDMPTEAWDKSVTPLSMTPRETMIHLCDCCQAFLSEDPSAYEWGSFDGDGISNEDIVSKYDELRSKCVDKVNMTGNDEVLKGASAYIALHEAYHVGQMASLRLSVDPNWNAYSIYGM